MRGGGAVAPVVVLAVLAVLVGMPRSGAGPTAHAVATRRPSTLPVPSASAAAAATLRTILRPPPQLPRTRRTVLHWVSGGLLRELVEVAPARVTTAPLALVVVLHGRRQTPWFAERIERWDRLAAAGRAVIAYGAGYAGSWDAGTCCGRALARDVNDDGYLLQALRSEEARHRIDRHRVDLVGFSNGGMLAFAFACRHADLVSAVATVAGTLELPSCRPGEPVSVVDVVGGRDRVAPYGGSRYSPFAGSSIASVPASMAPWRTVDAGTAEAVAVIRLPRLGHDWPTVQRVDWDGTAQLWRFLAAHPRATLSLTAARSRPPARAR